ncbi:MAG: hypothetical protein PWQ55_2679 [Chloroflexota bacterium]|nr:hypothetical protein [Chloroflexota bacterium]
MTSPIRLSPLLILSLILIACQPQAALVVETETPIPTEVPTIAPTATLEPTPTPQGRIFIEEFNGELQPGWTWNNEDPDNWRITDDGWLEIKASDESILHGNDQNNLLMRAAPAEGSFMIETLLHADTTSNFQQAAIFVVQDYSNFLNIARGYCSFCPQGGDGLYSDYVYQGEWGSVSGLSVAEDDYYLRIVVDRDQNQLVNYYSLDGENWVQQRMIPLNLEITQVGLGATNSDTANLDDDLTALFDYFEVKELE